MFISKTLPQLIQIELKVSLHFGNMSKILKTLTKRLVLNFKTIKNKINKIKSMKFNKKKLYLIHKNVF